MLTCTCQGWSLRNRDRVAPARSPHRNVTERRARGDLLGAIHLRWREARSRFFTLHRDPSLQAKRTLVFRPASWVFTLLLCQIRVTTHRPLDEGSKPEARLRALDASVDQEWPRPAPHAARAAVRQYFRLAGGAHSRYVARAQSALLEVSGERTLVHATANVRGVAQPELDRERTP